MAGVTKCDADLLERLALVLPLQHDADDGESDFAGSIENRSRHGLDAAREIASVDRPPPRLGGFDLVPVGFEC
ncbi:hypothetical protein D3C73_1422900 [compost metagenome]